MDIYYHDCRVDLGYGSCILETSLNVVRCSMLREQPASLMHDGVCEVGNCSSEGGVVRFFH